MTQTCEFSRSSKEVLVVKGAVCACPRPAGGIHEESFARIPLVRCDYHFAVERGTEPLHHIGMISFEVVACDVRRYSEEAVEVHAKGGEAMPILESDAVVSILEGGLMGGRPVLACSAPAVGHDIVCPQGGLRLDAHFGRVQELDDVHVSPPEIERGIEWVEVVDLPKEILPPASASAHEHMRVRGE